MDQVSDPSWKDSHALNRARQHIDSKLIWISRLACNRWENTFAGRPNGRASGVATSPAIAILLNGMQPRRAAGSELRRSVIVGRPARAFGAQGRLVPPRWLSNRRCQA